MSQPTSSTRTSTEMADSAAPKPSWIPLMKLSLFDQVIKKFGSVSPDTKCSIIYGPKPALFGDGQTLASTHYHVDACLSKRDTFIDGATFLMPSKLPMAGLAYYNVDLDEATGVHHVTLGKALLQESLRSTTSSIPDFSKHAVEFSNGQTRAVPHIAPAVANANGKTRKTLPRECQWDTSIAQPRHIPDFVRWIQFGMSGQDNEANKVGPVCDQFGKHQPSLDIAPKTTPNEIIQSGMISAPIGTDSSITEFGRIIGQQAADDQSSLSKFSESVMHIVPRNATASTSIEAKVSDTAVEAKERLASAVDIQMPDSSNPSRRSSTGSHGSGASNSTVPTSPGSSTFSTLPLWKLVVANLPEYPIYPGERTDAIESLALEELKHDDSKVVDCQDETDPHLLSLDLWHFNHWTKLVKGKLPRDVLAARKEVGMSEEGEIILVGHVNNNAHSSPTSSELFPDLNENQPVTQHVMENQKDSEASKETGCNTAANQSPGVLGNRLEVGESQDSAKSAGYPNFDRMIEEFFGDDNDEFNSTTSVSNIPRMPPVVNITPVDSKAQRPESATTSLPLGLCHSIPVDAIKEINTEFLRLWNEGVPGRCWIPGQDEEEVLSLAAVNVAPLYGGLPNDIISITKDFNNIVTELWQTQRSLVRGSSDDHVIHELAACNLKWRYAISYLKSNVNRSTANEATAQPRKIIEAAPSSFHWWLQVLGGDEQYREHRSFQVEKVDVNREAKYGSRDDTSFHHLNFNHDPVYERNHTPPEVSFWAASTTINKMLVPCAEHCSVHRVKVLTSQAFKKVDPVIYTGQNIQALRALMGSAMRNAATSDVEVAYEAVGKWNQDLFDFENVEPRTVSLSNGDEYEYCDSGPYNYLQRPYYIDDTHDEHNLYHVNDHLNSNPPLSRVRSGYEQRFTTFGKFRGVKSPNTRVQIRYSGKRSSWDPPAEENTTDLEIILDRASNPSFTVCNGPENTVSAQGSTFSTGNGLENAVPASDPTFPAGVGPEQLDPASVVSSASVPDDANPCDHVDNIRDVAQDDEGVASEDETDIDDEILYDREPVHYEGRHLITEEAEGADSSEYALEEAACTESEITDGDLRSPSVLNEEVNLEQEYTTLTSEHADLVSVKPRAEPVEQVEQPEPEIAKSFEYSAETTLNDGKELMRRINAQSFTFVSNIEDDEDNDRASVAGAECDDIDHSSTWAKRPNPEEHPKARDLARFTDGAPRRLSKLNNLATQKAQVVSQLMEDLSDLGLDAPQLNTANGWSIGNKEIREYLEASKNGIKPQLSIAGCAPKVAEEQAP